MTLKQQTLGTPTEHVEESKRLLVIFVRTRKAGQMKRMATDQRRADEEPVYSYHKKPHLNVNTQETQESV